MTVTSQGTVTSLLDPGPNVLSIAADATHVYWTDVTDVPLATIRRTTRTPNGGKSDVGQQLLVGQSGERFERLFVRGDCLYFWTVTLKGVSLRARPKTKVN